MNTSVLDHLKTNLKRGLAFVAVLLVGLTMIFGTVLNPAYAIWNDRDFPDPIGTPPPFQPPAEGFTWSVPPRYGFDSADADSLIDTYWNAVEMRYDPVYIYPDYWPMTFYGCQTEHDAEFYAGTDLTYQWNLNGQTLVGNTCRFTYQPGSSIGGVAMTGFPAQGTYTVTLTVTDPNGAIDPVSFEQSVYIRDYFIVALGDSYASGEGNPDVRQGVVDNFPFGYYWESDPIWQDKRCHRSAYAGASQAAQDLELADPKTSVTFISFACSGASTDTWMYKAIGGVPPIYNKDPDINQNIGAGILDYYRGVQPADSVGYEFNNYIPPQINQLRDALIPPAGKTNRQFDALVLSAGGNDIHFGEIVTACWLEGNCWEDSMVYENPYSGPYHIPDLINRALGNLPAIYADLAAEIAALDPAPAKVYITQYPDQTRNTNGGYCTLLDDLSHMDYIYKITPTEAQQLASSALSGLNLAIKTAANEHNWQYVDGLATYEDPITGAVTDGDFVSGPDGQGHGYCAADNWIRRAEEAEWYQGPLYIRLLSTGTLHPTERGHQAYAERILHYLTPNLDVVPNTDPPTFSSSFTSAGLTSDPGENSWFVGSYDSSNVYHPEVVLQVTATGSSPLTGASVTVNDEVGCFADGAVSCTMGVISATNQVQWDFAFTTDGIYELHFSVGDANNQVANYDTQIKVDLNAPIFTEQPWSFSLNEGDSLALTATAADASNSTLVFSWDLDNDGDFETPDEQPTFSAAALDGPTSPLVGVRVTDSAGWSATTTAAVDVLNVAPSAVINGAPATSAEGTAISLTSTVTDPATADTFTYAWEVKKDGVSFATGAEADFSFTPDDNGIFDVSLTVTDDDGGSVTSLQAIEVTNAAPVLSNVTVTPDMLDEGGSVTLAGDIAEAGSADTLELTLDWGDGSAAELVSLAAGSTSFSRTHTYTDDNPTVTPADTYAIALSLADDDGGSGTASASAVVNNLAPALSISAPAYGSLYALNTTVSLSAPVSDAGADDTLTCSVIWDDGTTTAGTISAGACSAERVYAAAGVYIIQMTVADDDSGSDTETVMVVVYDASAGFVTGGGWIDSPAGAYIPDPGLSGQATFGFVSKYHKGANVPDGNTEFEFETGGFEFASTSYEWLVVNQDGANAQFKGAGLVNGALDPNGSAYKFMVWANDGASAGRADTFRIRIWWEDAGGEHDVYDNGVDQSIGGGNIVVHKDK